MKKTILIAALMITVFTSNIFAILYVNRSCEAFNSCSPDANGGIAPSMGQMIIEGAGYFLASHADMQKFSNKIELSEINGVNYPELQEMLNSAIANMESASAVYKNLIQAAQETPYNRAVIHKLLKFDYRGFMKKNNLVADVFIKVKGFLARGDVTGAYIKLKTSKDAIVAQLYIIKTALDSNLFPDVNLLYQVNQAYCETLLFGQYIAQVFNNL
ncbi:MAG: hypothetical protein QG657_2492 [Acidobacteriota bacterium]|nr:hypothetical protein [Acidobacteriota bacterium]